MWRAIVSTQWNQAARTQSLRSAAVGLVAVLAIAVLWGKTAAPADLLGRLSSTLLIAGIVAGSYLTGWRISQFPKSRAAEFHLVTPATDWEIVGGEVACGMLKTLLVAGAALPVVATMMGAGWISPSEVFALLAVPVAAGWLAGVGLAVVAYEPLWVRRAIERLVLLGVLVYLVLCGLLGSSFVPWVYGKWSSMTGMPGSTAASFRDALRYLSPFRLLGAVGQMSSGGLGTRVLVVSCLLIALTLIGLWRLTVRLRPHYWEENFGRRLGEREYRRRIGSNPLAWWTARRVAGFKGNVNLYLAWTTIGLYAAWLVLGEQWPPWLAVNQLRVLERLGGAALLAVAAVHLAVVPVAFLNGLWDSNTGQRVRRLELLLTTPLSAGQYLTGSMVAGWARGRGYLLGAIVMWSAVAWSGRVSWLTCIMLCLLSANYLLLSFAVAFRYFARGGSDRDVSVRGLLWSIALPAITIGLFRTDWLAPAAMTPLGGMYFLSLPVAEQVSSSGMSPAMLWGIIVVAHLGMTAVSVVLLRGSLARFDGEIRDWFEDHLGPTRGRGERTGRRRPALPKRHTGWQPG